MSQPASHMGEGADDSAMAPVAMAPVAMSAVNAGAAQHPPGHMPSLGRFQHLQPLARGGLSTVFKAHDPQHGKPVAIKLLHASLNNDAECRSRFLREADINARLSHSNIVPVLETGLTENRPFLVLAWVDGAPLFDVLALRRTLPPQDAASIALQVAEALAHAHRHGVVHCDIKPGNLLLLRNQLEVRLIDFGIALVDVGPAGAGGGAVLGTPQYMSPEQARGEALDGRTDLYSLGLVLWQMLTGALPSRCEVSPAHPEGPAADALSARLHQIAARCLAPLPAQRPPSAQALAESLHQALHGIRPAGAIDPPLPPTATPQPAPAAHPPTPA